jgi:uncharacterized protein YpbB
MIVKQDKQERALIKALEEHIDDEFKQFRSFNMTCQSTCRNEKYYNFSMITGYCYEGCTFRDCDDSYDVDEDDIKESELDSLINLIHDMNELKEEMYKVCTAISERKALKAAAKLKASRIVTS